MKDKERAIKIMAKLAVYDKNHAEHDRKKAEFFRHDYVYRQNMMTRLFTLIGSVIVVIFYFMHRIFIGGMDVLDIEVIAADLIRMGIFVVVAQVVYSLIGLRIHSAEYNEAQERIKEYAENLEELSRLYGEQK